MIGARVAGPSLNDIGMKSNRVEILANPYIELNSAKARIISLWMLITTVGFAGVGPAHAAEPTGVLVPTAGASRDARWALDSTLELNSLRGRSLDLNVTVAPLGSIYESGLRIRASAGLSGYRYLADPETDAVADGTGRDFGVFAGYGFISQRTSIVGMVGNVRSVSRDDGRESNFRGYKVLATVFSRPDSRNLFYALASRSTAQGGNSQLVGKWGFRDAAGPYFGPEFNLTWRSTSSYERGPVTSKFGIHVSAWPVGPWFLGAAFGRYSERDFRIGTYLNCSLYRAF